MFPNFAIESYRIVIKREQTIPCPRSLTRDDIGQARAQRIRQHESHAEPCSLNKIPPCGKQFISRLDAVLTSPAAAIHISPEKKPVSAWWRGAIGMIPRTFFNQRTREHARHGGYTSTDPSSVAWLSRSERKCVPWVFLFSLSFLPEFLLQPYPRFAVLRYD